MTKYLFFQNGKLQKLVVNLLLMHLNPLIWIFWLVFDKLGQTIDKLNFPIDYNCQKNVA